MSNLRKLTEKERLAYMDENIFYEMKEEILLNQYGLFDVLKSINNFLQESAKEGNFYCNRIPYEERWDVGRLQTDLTKKEHQIQSIDIIWDENKIKLQVFGSGGVGDFVFDNTDKAGMQRLFKALHSILFEMQTVTEAQNNYSLSCRQSAAAKTKKERPLNQLIEGTLQEIFVQYPPNFSEKKVTYGNGKSQKEIHCMVYKEIQKQGLLPKYCAEEVGYNESFMKQIGRIAKDIL